MKRILFFIVFISNFTYCQINRPQHDPPEVVNKYTEVLVFDICTNSITVADASKFKIGDTVLMIQMKGAIIDTSNTSSFGTILNYGNAGNYEFNYLSNKSGNVLTFKNRLTKTYDIPEGIVQLVRVPKLKNAYFGGGLTCMQWDGTKGGVLAIIGINGLTCAESIDVSNMGFRGGEGYNASLPLSNCFANNYNYPSSSQLAGFKGEGISLLSQNISKGKGSPAASGGGGLSHNSGGGGGGNAGMGGFGGYQSDTCGNAPFDNRGIGGKNLTYTTAANKIFMGSGGGAGNADNTDFTAPPLSGGAGGGIAIIITDSLSIFDKGIYANGGNGTYCYSANCNDGMGGGGGGGTILISTYKMSDVFDIQAWGGDGGNISTPIVPGGKVGPGGGGGGGVIFLKANSIPSNIAITTNGGNKGNIINTNDSWGATNGNIGLNFLNLVLPFDTVLFKPNIDSVRIKDSLLTCNSFKFNGDSYTNSYPIATWHWDFADGNTASTQNTTHSFLSENSFPVKLIVTDINGCKDSITDIIKPVIITVDAGMTKSFCSNVPVSTTLHGNGNGSYAWMPAVYLNNSSLQNPIATIDTTRMFYLTVTHNGCSVTDSVKIIIYRNPKLAITKSNDINCTLPFTKLKVIGATKYAWSPSSTLDNSISANPIANPSTTTMYIVSGIDGNNCTSKDSITVVTDFSTSNIMLPNTFTPNGDGINDCFGIKYYRDVQNLVFIIYNRYGEKVFETTNATKCWDGYYKGQRADLGNYVYYLNGHTLCGHIIKKGSIVLMR